MNPAATQGNRDPAAGGDGVVSLAVLTSMATRRLMAELASLDAATGIPPLTVSSMGGAIIAELARDSLRADLLVLDEETIDALVEEKIVGGAVPLFHSDVVMGVSAGAQVPDVSSVQALCATLRAALSIGYSSGPSGRAFLKLLEACGLAQELAGRLVQAPPGIPVAQLIADGRVAVGVQQRSEFEGFDDVLILPLPERARIHSVFVGAVMCSSVHPHLADTALQGLASPALRPIIERHGMSYPNV